MQKLLERSYPVMPVLVVENPEHAVPLAEALVRGGLSVLEVTLRTPRAFAVIEQMLRVEGVTVGAGTVTNAGQLSRLADMGAHFAVSPGCTPVLLEAGVDSPVPLLPAVATASEIMLGREFGYFCFKLFPANVAGGLVALRAYSGPFPEVRFCPTGGIDVENAPDFLALDNVLCVGGSWVAPPSLVNAADWASITVRARAAMSLAR